MTVTDPDPIKLSSTLDELKARKDLLFMFTAVYTNTRRHSRNGCAPGAVPGLRPSLVYVADPGSGNSLMWIAWDASPVHKRLAKSKNRRPC